jgi:hypothetical protein
MYCRNCGFKIPINSNYCQHCGTKLLLQEEYPISFVETHYNLFIYALSTFYPFTIEQLTKYQDFLIWGDILYDDEFFFQTYVREFSLIENHPNLIYGVSLNQNLQWTSELFEKFREKFLMFFKHGDSKIIKQIIANYYNIEGFIPWQNVLQNKNIYWDKEFIHKYKTQFSWKDLIWHKNIDLEYIFDNLLENKKHIKKFSRGANIKDNLLIIEKYDKYWDWELLSQNHNIYWSPELLQKYESSLNWYALSSNPNIKWTIQCLQKYQKKLVIFSQSSVFAENHLWGIDRFVDNDLALILLNELVNPCFLSETLLLNSKQVMQKLIGFSVNKKIHWNIDLLRKYECCWDWYCLSKNDSIIFDKEILDEPNFQWNWDLLSSNKGVKWDLELIDRYDRYNQSGYPRKHDGPRFNTDFFTRYDRYGFDTMEWEVIKGLDSNPSINFNEELVNKYFENWNLDSLINNTSVIWTKDLLLKILNSSSFYKCVVIDYEGKPFQWHTVSSGEDDCGNCTQVYCLQPNEDVVETGDIGFVYEYEMDGYGTIIYERQVKNVQVKRNYFLTFSYEKIGLNFLANIWELVFKDYVGFYGIEILLKLGTKNRKI